MRGLAFQQRAGPALQQRGGLRHHGGCSEAAAAGRSLPAAVAREGPSAARGPPALAVCAALAPLAPLRRRRRRRARAGARTAVTAQAHDLAREHAIGKLKRLDEKIGDLATRRHEIEAKLAAVRARLTHDEEAGIGGGLAAHTAAPSNGHDRVRHSAHSHVSHQHAVQHEQIAGLAADAVVRLPGHARPSASSHPTHFEATLASRAAAAREATLAAAREARAEAARAAAAPPPPREATLAVSTQAEAQGFITAEASQTMEAEEEVEKEAEDVTSRMRFIAPLVPLGVFPYIKAKEELKKTADALVSSSPPGSQFYSWNGWSPDLKSPCYESIARWFPKALPATPVLERVKLFLSGRNGILPASTIFGSSLCPDEINSKKGGILDLMVDYWGEQFPLGGLGGVPLVGRTGWGAFSHHVPENGNIFVIYGPHVGVSESGEVGKILRPGQDGESAACGAFVGAYNQTANWDARKPAEALDSSDMQQQFIRNQLGPYRQELGKATNPMVALARQAFQIVDKQMLSIVDLDFTQTGKLALLGGIQVNTPSGYADHFEPVRFDIWQKGQPVKDIMRAFNPALDPMEMLEEK